MSNRFRPHFPTWRHLAAGAVVCGVSACETTTRDPEFANIHPWNVIPKSTPARMVSVFKAVCLADTMAKRQAALRANSYIATRDLGQGVRSFVADTTAPVVMLSNSKKSDGCAVGAQARTGQTSALSDMVATEFPNARPVDAATINPKAESAWATPDGTVLYLERHGPKVAPPRLIFAIIEPNAETANGDTAPSHNRVNIKTAYGVIDPERIVAAANAQQDAV